MKIVGVGSAFPEYLYPQAAITDAIKQHWGRRLTNPDLLERLHLRAGVTQRYLTFPIADYARPASFGETNRAWLEAGSMLGERALDDALARAGLVRRDIDALYVVSVTGIASPSLDARLINRMGLRSDIKRTTIFGVGCVGGALGLTRAADYARAYPDQVAALVSVELCSLTIQRDDLSTVNMIALGLFSDGAAAALVGGAQRGEPGPTILATRSVFFPATEQIMGWNISEAGFGIVLSAELPALIARELPHCLDGFLADNGLERSQVASWIVHPGGPKILRAIETALALKPCDLALSWEMLAEYGNFSSGSVLKVLEATLSRPHPPAGAYGLILAVGPGFSGEMLLLRW